jgi:SprT-like family
VTLQRHVRAKGYFAPQQFTGRVKNTTAHEIALNTDVFTGRSDELILSTLVHEMAHVWQPDAWKAAAPLLSRQSPGTDDDPLGIYLPTFPPRQHR